MARLAAIATVVLLAFIGVVFPGWLSQSTVKVIDDLALPLLSACAALSCALTARTSHGRNRSGWVAMTLALAAFAVGEAIWCYHDLILNQAPFPSSADVFFLMFPVAACVAMLFFGAPSSVRSQGQVLLDGLIVAGSLFIVSWALVMGRVYETGAATRLEFVLLMAYPVTDVVALTVAAVVVVRASPGQRATMALLGLGVAAMVLADSAYAYLSAQDQYTAGNRIDAIWVAGFLILTLAAAAGRQPGSQERGRDELPGWASVWLPYVPLAAALTVAITQPLSALTSPPLLPVWILLVVAVLMRQALAMKENQRLLAVVADQALRDPLTGLANRALFHDRLNHALQMRERTGSAVGVLLLDLDEFKLVNDTLGHPAGDEVLKRAGERVAASVHPGDTVARLGGDEFGVMTQGDPVLPEVVAHRIVDAFDEPITIDGRDLRMRPSIGLAVAPADQIGLTAEELLQHADMAMYASKRSRSQTAQTFSAQIPMAETESFALLREFRRALDTDELVLVYQPKFRLDSGVMVGVEALLRWQHPERGTLGPEEFLPMVRRHGLIEPVTAFVVDTALDDAARWRADGHDIPVAVNLFPPSLAVADLPGRLGDALRERGLPASALTVEITEDVLLDDIDRIRAVLLELRERGIRVSIDDFGSGYSALWYLRDLPVDQIKLDRGFIAPIIDDPRAAVVARAVINLAHALCMDTVAEGVEDPATADWLRRHGCDEVQGYHFSSPLRAAEVTTLRAPAAARSN